MAFWRVGVLLVALAGVLAFADEQATFPEAARELSSGDSRIVSGWFATEGQFPYQISLRMVNPSGGVTTCGGSIIHNNWGLTAAHCTALTVTIVVRAGVYILTYPELIFETTKYINHPRYIESLSVVQPHDIGLIDFDRSIQYTPTVQPIRLQRYADRNRNYDGVKMTTSGWGRTRSNGPAMEILYWVYLTGVSNLRCLVAYNFSPIVQPSTICTLGYNDTTQGPCQGDSGGPLTVVDTDGVVTQIGITSFVSGRGCEADIPAGFIRPGHYLSWFRQVTNINFNWVL